MHGGDIYNNKVDIDFSVNVNPLGPPDSIRKCVVKASEGLSAYPDYNSRLLRDKLAEYLNYDNDISADNIICGNGASELIMAVAHAFISDADNGVLIPVPSFYGYRRAFEAVGAKIVYYHVKEKESFSLDESFLDLVRDADIDIDMIVLANPNNPTGACVSSDLLISILDECKKRGIKVLLDECFIELSEASYAQDIDYTAYDNLMVIRAFTKSYAIPALRLGYMFSHNKSLIDEVSRHLPEWNVNLIAYQAGLCALELEKNAGEGTRQETQAGYLERSREMIRTERKFLTDELTKLGIRVYPSEANFLLIYSESDLYGYLLGRGILIRDCSDFIGLSKRYYRIAVRSHEDNKRLVHELGRLLTGRVS